MLSLKFECKKTLWKKVSETVKDVENKKHLITFF